jgi:putative Ca2+/H+ antiporter (TMEM165/GDT1 family)
LAFVLASRFRRPWTIMAGIFVATVANHFLAASLGTWVSQAVSPEVLKWSLGATFFVFAVWVLVPDKDESEDHGSRFGAFLTTTITFFLAEMGDKTQLSTVALAAKYDSVIRVTVGTTLGMLFSDGLAVFFGEKLTERVSMKWIRLVSAVLFFAFGIGILIGL